MNLLCAGRQGNVARFIPVIPESEGRLAVTFKGVSPDALAEPFDRAEAGGTLQQQTLRRKRRGNRLGANLAGAERHALNQVVIVTVTGARTGHAIVVVGKGEVKAETLAKGDQVLPHQPLRMEHLF